MGLPADLTTVASSQSKSTRKGKVDVTAYYLTIKMSLGAKQVNKLKAVEFEFEVLISTCVCSYDFFFCLLLFDSTQFRPSLSCTHCMALMQPHSIFFCPGKPFVFFTVCK